MKQVDRGDPRWVMAYWISQKDVKKMLIRPCQQFWRIFQVKYLSHNSSNQYCSKVVLDEFCELFPMVTFNSWRLVKIFQEFLLQWNAFVWGSHIGVRTKAENFRNAPKPNFDLYVISFICTNFEAFTTFSAIFTGLYHGSHEKFMNILLVFYGICLKNFTA